MNKLKTGCRGLLAAVIGCVLVSCDRGADRSPPEEAPRIETMTLGPVTLRFEASPAAVRPDRDMLLTVRITCPSEMEVAAPELGDRVQGFDLAGFFAVEPTQSGGRTTYEYQARLTPRVADEYRLAPMALGYTDHSESPAAEGWIATEPIVFEVALLPGGGGISTEVEPVWIRPSFATVAAWMLGVLVAVALLYGLWRLARRVKHEVKLRRMSPRERAMHELDALLSQDLPGQHKVKEFYLELTMIVRRYIERRHGIRAPEQTTEEFLVAVRDDRRFRPDVLQRLTDFLEAADLVKFAAHRPDPGAIDAATRTARDYIRTDAAEADSPDAPGSQSTDGADGVREKGGESGTRGH